MGFGIDELKIYGLSKCKNNCVNCINSNNAREICLVCKTNNTNCFTNYILPKETNYLDDWLTKTGEIMTKSFCNFTEVLGGGIDMRPD